MKWFMVDMMEEICGNCQYFRQHYIKVEHNFVECNAGHCWYPRLKTRSPGFKGCAHFVFKNAAYGIKKGDSRQESNSKREPQAQ